MPKTRYFEKGKIKYICGKCRKKNHGWVTVNLARNRDGTGIDNSDEAIGTALIILYLYEALESVRLFTEDEWCEHPASSSCGVSCMDLGFEVLF